MNGILALALMLGVTVLVLLLCVAVRHYSVGAQSREHDERQILAQGKAYQLSGMVALVYYGVLAVFLPVGLPNETVKTLLFFGLYVDMIVFATYSVLSDAYVGRSNTEWGAGLGFLVVGVLHLGLFGLNLAQYDGVIPFEGTGAGSFRSIIMGVGFGYLGILLLVKHWRNKREAAEE